MDIRIFGSLTTSACRVGGTLERSIFERIYGSMDPLLLTADPFPYHLSPYHAFSKNGCVFFPMDIRIFGSLTTNACRVGGSLEVSIFERIRGSVDSLLSTEDPLPYHLRPYHL